MAKNDNLKDFLTDVADAIREKKRTTGKINPQDFSSEIKSIETGGGVVESKEYKDVNFFDYEGTILYSYTWEEAQALTEMPPLPSHDGLICQGWNWTFDELQQSDGYAHIGATYITDDGKTRLYLRIAAKGRMDIPLFINQNVSEGVVIDWGDGSPLSTITGTGNVTTTHTYSEIGSYIITLDVLPNCALGLGYNNNSCSVIANTAADSKVFNNMLKKVEIGANVVNIGKYAFQNCSSLTTVVIPQGVNLISDYAFAGCTSILFVVAPVTVNNINQYAFYQCSSLKFISTSNAAILGSNSFNGCTTLAAFVIPKRNADISLFGNCNALSSVAIPNSVKTIGRYAFNNNNSLASVILPNSVTNISTSAFANLYSAAFLDFATFSSIPTISDSNVFQNLQKRCKIVVPDALVDEWKAATNWATYADYIIGKTEYLNSGGEL